MGIEDGSQKTPRRTISNGGFSDFLILIVAGQLQYQVVLARGLKDQNSRLITNGPVQFDLKALDPINAWRTGSFCGPFCIRIFCVPPSGCHVSGSDRNSTSRGAQDS